MPSFHKELVWHTFLILLAALVFVHAQNSPCMAEVNTSKFTQRQVDANSKERSGGRFFQPRYFQATVVNYLFFHYLPLAYMVIIYKYINIYKYIYIYIYYIYNIYIRV